MRLLTATFCFALVAYSAAAQGPSPENGATLFPGGGVVAYNSIFVTREALPSTGSISIRPTFAHRGQFFFGWGIRRDVQFTAILPVVTTRREMFPAGSLTRAGGTGLGDITLLLKYRFYRADSKRGTTQLSLVAGPKLPTGKTNVRDANGALLPMGLQPGSGSTDAQLGLSATYTGLFGVKRLVADEVLTYQIRSEGTQQMKFGNSLESRLWITHRPYQSKTVGPEWFIGPVLVWQHAERDRQASVENPNSGGDVLALGVTTYFSPGPGVVLWLSAEFPVAQTRRGAQTQLEQRYSFGVTRQFRLRR